MAKMLGNRSHSAAGQEFLTGAKETLTTAAASVNAARNVAERDARLLRLGFCSYAMKLGFGETINAFRSAWPDVQLVFNDLPGNEQLQRLDRGELDLAICSQLFPDSPFFAGFETLTLASERLVGIIPPAGASQLPVPNRFQDFAELPFVGLDRNVFSEYWRFLDRLCETHGVRLRLILQAKEKHSLMMLVAGGMGVSILPAHVAGTVPGTLRIVPIPDLTEEIPVVVAFQRHSQNSMLPAFLTVLKDCLELRTSNYHLNGSARFSA